MNVPRDKSYADYLTESLTDPAEAAAYLDAVMELGEPAAMLVALRHVVKAHGMAEVTRRAEVSDKHLFKALGDNGNPTLDTVNRVLHAVGLRLSVAPATQDTEHA